MNEVIRYTGEVGFHTSDNAIFKKYERNNFTDF